jgi:hypothetical protein
MKLICTLPVRNEQWCLGLSARAVLQWCDELVIGLHACTDRSQEIALEIANEHPDRVTIMEFPETTWTEMAHRQALLETARMRGATHIVIVDADEVLSASLLNRIRVMVSQTPRSAVLQLPWLCLRGGIDRYHATGTWSQQNVSTAFMDAPELHWKAQGPEGYDFHHRHPMGRELTSWTPLGGPAPFSPAVVNRGGLMHLQFVSGRRLRAKQALYKLTEVLRWPGREPVEQIDRRYNLAVYGSYDPPKDIDNDAVTATLRAVPGAWWDAYADLMKHLKPHETPWQEAECLRLIAEHGLKRFAGLDLFGIGESFHER